MSDFKHKITRHSKKQECMEGMIERNDFLFFPVYTGKKRKSIESTWSSDITRQRLKSAIQIC